MFSENNDHFFQEIHSIRLFSEENSIGKYIYDIPLKDSKAVTGTCGYLMDEMFIKWQDKNKTATMKLTFTFKNAHEHLEIYIYMLSEIAFYVPSEMLNISEDKSLQLFYRGDILETKLGESYCSKGNYRQLSLTNEYGNHFMGTLELYDLCFEANSKYESDKKHAIFVFIISMYL